jgi:hypothetical protein
MAYSVGKILQARWGYTLINVQVPGPSTAWSMFGTEPPPSISPEELERSASPADILVCNPSFSRLGLASRFPGKSISYVQGIDTYDFLDPGFTHHVAASPIIRSYLAAVHDVSAMVIPPFIEASNVRLDAWSQRPARTVLVNRKGNSAHHDRLYDEVINGIRDLVPDVTFQPLLSGDGPMTRRELLERLAGHRYLLNLVTVEGFGLIPLEAMASGTIVMGFDGSGGRHYMRPQENCMAVPYHKPGQAISNAVEALQVEGLCRIMAVQAQITASQFSKATFEESWRAALSHIVGWKMVA